MSAPDDSQRNPLERLARGSGLNILGAVCQQGALLLTTGLIARFLGSGALGQYALAYAMLTVLGLLALCGFRAALTRFIATQLADSDPGAVRGTVRMCITIGVLGSIVVGAVLFATAPEVAGLFHEKDLVGAIRCVAVALPGATIRDSALAATQGWRTQRAFTLIGWVYEPLVRFAVTAIALSLGFGLSGAFFALLFGTWTAAVAAARALQVRMRTVERAPRRFEKRSILSFSMVSWGTTVASTGLIWADTLLIGHFKTASDVGVYNVATRLVTLAVFVMAPINAAFAPQFAHHFHKKEQQLLAQAYTSTTSWILRLSLPAFVVLVVFPSDLLRIFGDQYAVGATVTVVLAVGQLINAATGPCGTALNMAGRVGINMANNVSVLILNVLLNLFWIPQHGIVGAALAWSVSLAVVNVVRVVQVYFVTGVSPFGIGTIRSFAAAAAAALAAIGVRALVLPVGLEVLVGAVAALVVYGLATLALGLDGDERRMVRALLRGRRARATS